MEQKLLNLFKLQDEFNKRVNPEWITAGYNFLLAAQLEAAEAIEHLPWKWWKATTVHNLDMLFSELPTKIQNAVKLEIVDVLHFALSVDLVHQAEDGEDIDNAVESIVANAGRIVCDSRAAVRVVVNRLQAIMQVTEDLDVGIWEPLFHAANSVGMDFDDLYCLYLAKNTLNTFRQNNGYKQGTYCKNWYDGEDNDYLFSLAPKIQCYAADTQREADGESLMQDIYSMLVVTYADVTKQDIDKVV